MQTACQARMTICRNKYLYCVAAAVLQSCATPGISLAQSSDELAIRFLAEAPKCWAEYEKFAQNLSGTVDISVDSTNKAFSRHNTGIIRHNDNCRSCWSKSLVNNAKTEYVLAFNRAYTFSLNRKGSQQPWVITSLQARQDGDSENLTKQLAERTNLLRMLIQAVGDDASLLLRQPNFRVITARHGTKDGIELVEMVFDNTHAVNVDGSDFFQIQAGTLFVDPERSWCVMGYKLNLKHTTGDSTVECARTLAALSGKYPIPALSIQKYDYVRNATREKVSDTTKWAFDLQEAKSLPPDSEFTLTAFGLPEPPGMDAFARPRWYLWAGGAGILCLVMGVIIGKRRRAAA